MVKRFEIGQSAAKHLTKGDEGSTTSQSNLRRFFAFVKKARRRNGHEWVPGFYKPEDIV